MGCCSKDLNHLVLAEMLADNQATSPGFTECFVGLWYVYYLMLWHDALSLQWGAL